MLVKNIKVAAMPPNASIDFNIEELKLLNARGEAAVIEGLSNENSSAELSRQRNVLGATATGRMKPSSDKSVLQITIGQSQGLTWSLNVVPQTNTETEFNCQFFVPPTSIFPLSRLLPIPVKSVCVAGKTEV